MNGNWREILYPGSIFGNYHVVKRIGSGGMSEVFLVEGEPGVHYAIKVIDPEVAAAEPEFLTRFVREAEFAMRTRHPNIVEVYDARQDAETGLCYLVMEYMPGGSLRDVLRVAGGGLSVSGTVAVAMDVARALVLIESHGMVHRDVKPDNVLFAADGTAKLTDLGISRFAKGPDVRMTRAEAVIGTPAYMAPEQMIDSHAVDIRADIYAFGVMLYEMLAGRRPNDGEGAMRTLAKAIEGRTFPDVRAARPDIPAELAVLVNEMTLPDADQRPRTARMVMELLTHPERVPTGELPSAPSLPKPPWYRDRAVLYAVTAMALALEALVLAVLRVMKGA